MSTIEQRDIAVAALKFITDRGWGGIVCETYARRELNRIAEAGEDAPFGWQPIETAPETYPHKGGRPIDIWADGKRFASCFQLKGYPGWWQVSAFGGPCALPPQIVPAHWMPLPEPPQETSK